jgi:hypothetical protein
VNLTEQELVEHLNRAGMTVTRRRVMTWRDKGLLPDFDAAGSGLGRSLGRVPSYWEDADAIISQAATVYNLLRWHDRVEELYLPLWLLGHRVPDKIVRRKLREEVAYGLEELAKRDQKSRYREDSLTEWASEVYSKWRRSEGADVPIFENIDQAFQLVGNDDYTPDDPLSPGQQFVRDHLSLRALDEYILTATSEEISNLQQDFVLLSYIARSVFGLVPGIVEGINVYSLASLAGRLLALLDLAVRRAGFGPEIEFYLELCASWLRDNPHVLREMFEQKRLQRRQSAPGDELSVVSLT